MIRSPRVRIDPSLADTARCPGCPHLGRAWVRSERRSTARTRLGRPARVPRRKNGRRRCAAARVRRRRATAQCSREGQHSASGRFDLRADFDHRDGRVRFRSNLSRRELPGSRASCGRHPGFASESSGRVAFPAARQGSLCHPRGVFTATAPSPSRRGICAGRGTIRATAASGTDFRWRVGCAARPCLRVAWGRLRRSSTNAAEGRKPRGRAQPGSCSALRLRGNRKREPKPEPLCRDGFQPRVGPWRWRGR